MGDTRRKGNIIPLGFRVMEVFASGAYSKGDRHKGTAQLYFNRLLEKAEHKYNFLLIAHEYLFIFKK